MFFDSHAHLDDIKFEEDRDVLIRGLLNRGVACVINPGDTIESLGCHRTC